MYAKIDKDNIVIELSSDNIEGFLHCQDWMNIGMYYHPELPPKQVFIDLTPRQFRFALTQLNLRQQVEEIVKSGDQYLKDWWEFSLSYERNHPQITALCTALNITSSQMDELFQLAATL